QLPSFRVIADDTHRQRVGAKGSQVMYGIGSAARHQLCFSLIQDQHRGATGDPGDLSVNEDIGHKIAKYCDSSSLEAVEQLTQTIHPTCPERMASTARSRLSATKVG